MKIAFHFLTFISEFFQKLFLYSEFLNFFLTVMLFGHEGAMSSKSNFIGAFQNDCNVASIVEGMIRIFKQNQCNRYRENYPQAGSRMPELGG